MPKSKFALFNSCGVCLNFVFFAAQNITFHCFFGPLFNKMHVWNRALFHPNAITQTSWFVVNYCGCTRTALRIVDASSSNQAAVNLGSRETRRLNFVYIQLDKMFFMFMLRKRPLINSTQFRLKSTNRMMTLKCFYKCSWKNSIMIGSVFIVFL